MKTKGKFGFISKIGLLNLLLLVAVPSVVVASVVVAYNYPVATTTASDQIYLAQGSNYAAASSLGLISGLTSVTTGTETNSGTTITVSNSAGGGTVYMMDVLEVVNTTSITTPVFLFINGSLPSGVTMYYSLAPMTFDGTYVVNSTTVITGTTVTGGPTAFSGSSFSEQVHLYPPTTGNVNLYFAFVVSPTTTSGQSTTLTFQYSM